jgi:membrane protease YdiL (CAAX protease family)
MKTYLDVAREGKNDWWRYVLSLAFILFMWFIVGSIPIFVLLFFVSVDGDPATSLDAAGSFLGVDPLLAFIATVSSFLTFFLSVPLAVRFLHGRPVRTLITASEHINWGRLFRSFGLWFVLSAWISLVEALLYPGRYELTLNLGKLIPFAVATLLLIPFQTSAEELFFRGYLIQWIGLKVGNWVVLSIISGLLFALPHVLNPEVDVNFWLVMSFYFLFGVFAAWVTLKDNGLEIALGMHAANNIYAAIIANYTNSALQTPAIFTVNELDPVYGLISPAVAMVVFYLVLFQPWKQVKKELT